jgi:hypothetical protein
VVDIRAEGLPEVDARLRAGDQEFDAVLLRLGQRVHNRLGRVDAERHRILAGQSHRLLPHQQVLKAGAVQSAMADQLHDVQKCAAAEDVHRFDSDRKHTLPLS